MPELVSVHNVCTAKHLNDMNVPLVGSPQYTNYIRKLINLPPLNDFAMVYAITTAIQYKNAKPVLELIGFEEVFTGKKNIYISQRHRETGALTMWCCSIDKWSTKNERLKPLIEIKLEGIVHRKDMTKNDSFFTMIDFNRKFNKLCTLDDYIHSGKPFMVTYAEYAASMEDTWGINPGLNPTISTFRQYKDIQNELVRKAKGD